VRRLQKEKDALQAKNDALQSEKDAMQKEKDDAMRKKDIHFSDQLSEMKEMYVENRELDKKRASSELGQKMEKATKQFAAEIEEATKQAVNAEKQCQTEMDELKAQMAEDLMISQGVVLDALSAERVASECKGEVIRLTQKLESEHSSCISLSHHEKLVTEQVGEYKGEIICLQQKLESEHSNCIPFHQHEKIMLDHSNCIPIAQHELEINKRLKKEMIREMSELAKLQSEHSGAFSRMAAILEKAHDEKIQAMSTKQKKEHDERVASLVTSHESEIAKLNEKHKMDLVTLDGNPEKLLSDIEERYEKDVGSLTAQLKEASTKCGLYASKLEETTKQLKETEARSVQAEIETADKLYEARKLAVENDDGMIVPSHIRITLERQRSTITEHEATIREQSREIKKHSDQEARIKAGSVTNVYLAKCAQLESSLAQVHDLTIKLEEAQTSLSEFDARQKKFTSDMESVEFDTEELVKQRSRACKQMISKMIARFLELTYCNAMRAVQIRWLWNMHKDLTTMNNELEDLKNDSKPAHARSVLMLLLQQRLNYERDRCARHVVLGWNAGMQAGRLEDLKQTFNLREATAHQEVEEAREYCKELNNQVNEIRGKLKEHDKDGAKTKAVEESTMKSIKIESLEAELETAVATIDQSDMRDKANSASIEVLQESMAKLQEELRDRHELVKQQAALLETEREKRQAWNEAIDSMQVEHRTKLKKIGETREIEVADTVEAFGNQIAEYEQKVMALTKEVNEEKAKQSQLYDSNKELKSKYLNAQQGQKIAVAEQFDLEQRLEEMEAQLREQNVLMRQLKAEKAKGGTSAHAQDLGFKLPW